MQIHSFTHTNVRNHTNQLNIPKTNPSDRVLIDIAIVAEFGERPVAFYHKVNHMPRRIVSSGLLRRVALVRTDVSEEPGADVRCEEILGISSQRTSVASCSLCCS
jgi:hypothetical protein